MECKDKLQGCCHHIHFHSGTHTPQMILWAALLTCCTAPSLCTVQRRHIQLNKNTICSILILQPAVYAKQQLPVGDPDVIHFQSDCANAQTPTWCTHTRCHIDTECARRQMGR